MKTRSQKSKLRIWMGIISFALVILTIAPRTALAQQWSVDPNNSVNIYYNSGNVGIGTASPSSRLDIAAPSSGYALAANGVANAYTAAFTGSPTTGQSFGILLDAGTNSSDAALRLRSYSGSDYLYVRGDGNVGIGTTSPSTSLHISSSSPTRGIAQIIGASGSTGAQIQLTQGGVDDWAFGQPAGVSAFAVWSGRAVGSNGTERFRIDSSGNVGIGTTSPTQKLDVVGNINVSGSGAGNITASGTINAKYQDVAEWVPTSQQIPSGTVVVLDTTKSNQVISSTQSYDTRVAGVVSERPGLSLGEGGANKVLVATTGRVMVNVDATNGPIHIGDLLVTSDISGVAMKSEPITIGNRKMHMPGTLIGKALEPLEKGSGKILVLLSLQ